MKSLVFSSILLITVIAVSIGGAIYTSVTLNKLCEQINEEFEECGESCEDISYVACDLKSEFERVEPGLSLFINDDELSEMRGYYTDIRSAAVADSYEGALTAKSRLVSMIEHLRRLSSFNIDSIF